MAEDNGINGIAWFLAGLGVGALVGVLYAPKSGRETREDIATSAREGADYVRVRGKQAAEYAGDLYEKGKQHAGDYADRGRQQWDDVVDRGRNLVNDQTSRVTAAVQAGKEAYRTGETSGS
ncbi:YtxH domain-containing protein [Terracidiphilus sp.]|jgi:gas vesicle protein|uniref:YtxH domain-containing protein n=1 Tax=Terracidiphilus sp. TaxID=1964191 RepID=UPI003C27AF3E